MDFDYRFLPKAEGVRLLWHDSFWDHPRDGVCEWQNKKYHFDFIADNENRVRYTLRRMSEEEWTARQQKHEQFRQHVGHHTDYVYDAHGIASRQIGNCKQESQHHLYYNAPGVKIPISDEKIVAWFDKW